MMMLILVKNEDNALKNLAWDSIKDNLKSSVTPGFRKEIKRELDLDFSGLADERKAEENRRLKKEINKWEKEMMSYFDVS